MCEEGAAKLRLKPRTAPAESRSRRPTSTDRCSWLEEEDLNECEKTWILLLKDIGQDLHCTDWDTVPCFPEFLEKSAEEESPGHQEVFTAGKKDFQWVSFPSFPKDKCLNPEELGSQQPPQSQSNESHPGQGQAGKLPSLSSTAGNTCRGTRTDRGRAAAGEGTEGIPNLEASPESRKHPGHAGRAEPPARSCPQQHTGTAQSCRDSAEKEPHPGNIPAGEDRAVPAERPPGAGSCPEAENQSEGSAALDSCPMCLVRFSATLSQLDIDGHLDKCLSESADDVMW